jgi:predicted ATP-dependent endonuclease of OLD family
MYLRDLHIRNFKLLRDFKLSFSDESGKPRMWTVILGENGTGKTSILQAIALAAAGERNLSGLGANVSSLPDKRAPKEPLQIDAAFSLDARHREQRSYPGLAGKRVTGEVWIDSKVTLRPGAKTFRAHSLYRAEKTDEDPIDAARASDEKFWFVAAYGIQRFLPRDPTQRPTLEHASIDRLRPAFQPVDLVGTNFANILRGKKATMYAKVLRQTLFGVEDLLPGFRNLELRGQGGARTAQHIQESHRFIQKLPSGDLKLAASWLSHGYQSTIAWIADLVGQILWEAKATEPLDASEMEGLVLIDEIDLYLHPRWQRSP